MENIKCSEVGMSRVWRWRGKVQRYSEGVYQSEAKKLIVCHANVLYCKKNLFNFVYLIFLIKFTYSLKKNIMIRGYPCEKLDVLFINHLSEKNVSNISNIIIKIYFFKQDYTI